MRPVSLPAPSRARAAGETRERQLAEAAAHPRQTERLRALRSYGVLDSEREKDFDDVVALVASLCDAPISVINLIDAGRQWFKAEIGLGVRETPLDTSICAHILLERDFVEIEDTLQDPRLRDNPLCLGGPGIRFYAGALLKTADGLPLGTLCVLDVRPRRLSPLQRDAIRVLAAQVMKQLELRKALHTQNLLRQEVDHRVKNSLQAVAALVQLKARRAVSEEATAALLDIRTRLGTVAALHEEMHQADAGGSVDLRVYMERVCGLLGKTLPATVALAADMDAASLTSREAAAAAGIVNEFVANSAKHAFPSRRPGRITVTGRSGEDSVYSLTCEDDGVGLQGDLGSIDSGLGFRIIEAYGGELGGRTAFEPLSPGLRLRVVFEPSLREGR